MKLNNVYKYRRGLFFGSLYYAGGISVIILEVMSLAVMAISILYSFGLIFNNIKYSAYLGMVAVIIALQSMNLRREIEKPIHKGFFMLLISRSILPYYIIYSIAYYYLEYTRS